MPLQDFGNRIKNYIEGIPGFRFMFLRMVANFLMFVALIWCFFQMLGTIFVANHSQWLVIGPFLSLLPFYIIYLTQNDFIDNHRLVFLIMGFLFGFGLLGILFYLVKAPFDLFLTFYFPLTFAMEGLIIGRHFILSIYRTQRKYYFIGLAIFFAFWLGIGWTSIGITVLIPVIITGCAVLLNAYGEYQLCERKLMHYI